MNISKITNKLAPVQPTCLSVENTDSLFNLLNELQNEADLYSLIATFSHYINKFYEVEGMRYSHPLSGMNLLHGTVCKHKHSTKLQTNQQNWGSLVFYSKHRLATEDKQRIDAISRLLAQFIILAVGEQVNLIQTSDDFEICLESPLITEKMIIREAKLAHKERTPMSIILLDVDHFKNITRMLGSTSGDHLLFALMKRLLENIQSTDFLFRYKSDTFCLILKGIEGKFAYTIGERLRRCIESHLFKIDNKESIRATLSCGIAELQKTDSYETFFGRANNALAHAKKMGRNTSILADGRFISHKTINN